MKYKHRIKQHFSLIIHYDGRIQHTHIYTYTYTHVHMNILILTLSFASMSARASSSNLTALAWPYWAANMSAAAILCCSGTLKRSADAFLSSSLVISFFATSRAVLPSYTCLIEIIYYYNILVILLLTYIACFFCFISIASSCLV